MYKQNIAQLEYFINYISIFKSIKRDCIAGGLHNLVYVFYDEIINHFG